MAAGRKGETSSAYRGVGTHLAGFHLIPRVFNVRSFHHTGQHQMTNDAVALLELVSTSTAIFSQTSPCFTHATSRFFLILSLRHRLFLSWFGMPLISTGVRVFSRFCLMSRERWAVRSSSNVIRASLGCFSIVRRTFNGRWPTG